MVSKILAAFLLLSTFIAAPACARTSVPIVNHDNVAVVTNSGNTPDAKQVEKALVAAASAKGWTIEAQGDGKLQATLVVRNKHTIIVEVGYTASSYSLMYKGSDNMNYGQRDGEAVIHPFYNRWVDGLKEAIRLELLKL